MKHFKQFFVFALLALFSVGAWGETIDFTAQGYANQEAVTSVSGTDCTITFDKGTNSNAPKYFTSGTAIRAYGGNTITIASASKTIEGITFTFGSSDGSNAITADEGTFSSPTWSGSASSVTFTIGGTSGNRRLASVEVTYASGGTPTPSLSAAPTTIDFGTVEQGASVAAKTVAVTFANLTGSVTYSGLSGAFAATGTITNSGDEITITPSTATIGEYEQTLTIQSTADSKSQAVTVTMNVVEPFDGLKLTFDVSSNPGEWPTTNAASLTNYTYALNAVDYTFALKNIKCNSGYLMMTATAVLGLPAIEGYKLVKVEATNSSGCSTSTQVKITSDEAGDEVVSGGAAQTFSTTSTKYTYTLSDTEENTMYYLIATNKNCQLVTLVLYYEEATPSTPKAVKPTFTGDETFLNSTSVSLSTTTEGASIYYTMGDAPADPTASSTLYEGPINVTATTTIKAIAVKAGMDNSPVAEKTFTKATIMTVAEARTAIDAAGSTPIANQYVAGTISQIDSYNSTYNSITYWISDDGTTTNQLEVYSGKGLNGANFSAISDLSLGDEVIVTGTLKKFSSTYEFDMNSQIVQLTRDIAAPTFTPDGGGFLSTLSVSLACTTDGAVIRYTTDNSDPTELSTEYTTALELTATTTIKAAAFKGESVSAIITKTFTKGTKITVADALAALDANDPIEHQFVYGKVSTAPTSNPNSGRLTYYISDDGTTTDQLEVYNGYGLSGAAFTDKTDLQVGDEVTVYGTLKIYNTTKEFDGGNYLLEFNRKADAGLAWDPADDITLTVGDAFTAPTLLNPNSIDAAEITIASSNTSVATVTAGVVELVADATGTATITATFAGNASYKPATVSYEITVNAAPVVLTDYYEKVTSTAGIVEGTYLIVYEDAEVAFNGALGYDNDHKIDIENNTIDVEITADHKIGVTTATEASTFYIDPEAGTIQAASGKYIGVGGYSNGLAVSDDASAYNNALSIDADGNAVIVISTSGGDMTLRYNSASNQARFRYYKSGQQAIALYKLANEVIKPEAGLAWDPADDIELTVGGAFTAPTLDNPNGIDAAEITIASDNTDLATVSAGVVSLVENATGTATITATFAGNASYKPATVSYIIKVNPASSIYVAPSLNVNFGSVEKDATAPADQTITVTLNNVAAATATLGGANPEAFSVDKTALTASGDITISVTGTATAGEFKATLTISDDASAAASKEVKLSFTVTDPASEETAISTSTEWVAATEITDGMQVLIVGVNGEDYYAMGEQTNNNRTAVQATMDGEGVLTPGEGTMAFTLVAQGDGTFALRTSNGKYLYAASSGSNYLRSQAELDDNGKWTLTTTSAIAAGSNTRNTMQFNSGSSIFACYGSASQKPIAFYVPKPVTPPTPDYTEVRNGLNAGEYYTMCLNKAVNAVQGGTIWKVVSKAANGTDVILGEAELPLDAGRPYIFCATASTLQVEYTGDAVGDPLTEGNNGLVGSFSKAPITKDANNYIIYNNELYLVNSDNVYVGANRAYLSMNAVPNYSAAAPAPGRRYITMSVHNEQTTTDLDALNASEIPVKMIINGQLFILRGEKLYNANGQLVK